MGARAAVADPRSGSARLRAGRAPARAAVPLRVLRAALFALVCTALAAAGHCLSSGGHPVPLATLLAAWAALTAAATLLAGRERRAPAIAGALAAGQLGLHLWFMAAQCRAADSAASRLAAHLLCGAHAHDPAAARAVLRSAGIGQAAGSGMDMGGGAHAFLGLSPGMLAAHLLAAVAAGLWLRSGEAALWDLLRLAARAAGGLRVALALAVVLLFGAGGAASPRRVRRPARDGRRPDPAHGLLLHCVVRRGPPRAAADTAHLRLAA